MKWTAKTFRSMLDNLYGFHIIDHLGNYMHSEGGFTSKVQAKYAAAKKLKELAS